MNKELKRRTKSMETVGGKTLDILVAFTAMRLEYHWQRFKVDAPHLEKLSKKKGNAVEDMVVKLVKR